MNIGYYHLAHSLDEAYQMLLDYDQAVILGGGAWLKMGTRALERVIDLKALGLQSINETETTISIGSMTTLRDMEMHPSIQALGGGFLSQALSQIMGVAFRNIATIGGSIIGKYAFSDILTPLLTLDVTLQFHHRGDMTLNEFLAHRGKLIDILVGIAIKKTPCQGMFKKVSNTNLDFSIVNLAITNLNGQIAIVVGARPGIAKRADEVMAWLNSHKNPTDQTWKEAAEKVIETLEFGTNQRGQQSYRKQLVKTYVYRGLKEVHQR